MACNSWLNCPPAVAWQRGLKRWQADSSLTTSDLLSPALLKAAHTPLLIASPQAPTQLLEQMGAWPLDGTGERKTYALGAAEKIRDLGLAFNATFMPTCAAPGPALLDHSLYYYTLANCTNGYGFSYAFALTQVG